MSDCFSVFNIKYQYICTILSKDSKLYQIWTFLQKTMLTSVQIPINNIMMGTLSPAANYTHSQCSSILKHKSISTLGLCNNENIHTFAHYHPSPNGSKHFLIITTGNSWNHVTSWKKNSMLSYVKMYSMCGPFHQATKLLYNQTYSLH